MLRDNPVGSSHQCLENPRPAGAELSLTEDVTSPFQAEPRQNHCAIVRRRCGQWLRVSIRTAELDRRIQVTATKSWGPTLTETVGREVDYQVAAPTETRTPTLHRANIAHRECGWKDGDRGGLAE